MRASRYEGLIVAPHTPFKPDGSLALSVIPQQAQLFQESGIRAAFICGSTGESHSMTVAERIEVAEHWAALGAESLPLLVHVGSNCQRDAVTLAAHAGRIGAAGVAAMAPCYFKPTTIEALADFLAPIAAAAPNVPFYYYDIPALSGVRFPADQLLRQAAQRIENFVGIKYTSDDLMALQKCLAVEDGAYEMLFGNDELLLVGVSLGCRGAIGSTYNYAAPLHQRILRAYEAGDMPLAREEQRKSVALVDILIKHGVLRAGKAIMGMLGVDCGPPRSPISPLSPADVKALYQSLQPLDGIFCRPLNPSAT